MADVHPYDLPPPVRKLVALAGVFAMGPGVLVLDEPTAGLDRAGRDRVIAALGRALGLPGAPIRVEECVAALGGVRWRGA